MGRAQPPCRTGGRAGLAAARALSREKFIGCVRRDPPAIWDGGGGVVPSGAQSSAERLAGAGREDHLGARPRADRAAAGRGVLYAMVCGPGRGGSGAACRRPTTSPGRSGSRSSSIRKEKVCARPRARQGVQGVVVRGRGLHLAGLRVGGRRTPAPLSGEAESAIIAGHSGARDEMASCGGARKAFYTRFARLGRQVTQYANWPLA